MKKFLLVAFLFFGSQEVFAAGGAPCGDYGECDSFKPELNNMESLQLGALTFYQSLLWLPFAKIFSMGKNCKRPGYSRGHFQ
jgi:hypothetical protein